MRTDLVWACHRCRLRLPEGAPTCPVCDGDRLRPAPEVSRIPPRRRGLDLGRWGRWLRPGLDWGPPAAGAIAGAVGWAIDGLHGGGMRWILLGIFIGGVSGLPLRGLARGRLEARRHRPPLPPIPLRPWSDDPEPAATETFVGTVEAPVAGASLQAPDGTACVAFRLAGTVEGWPVDDGAAVPFVIASTDPVPARILVEPTVAVVDVAASLTPARPVLPSPGGLDVFLSARGIPIAGTAEPYALLGCGTIMPGDVVAVSGRVDVRPDPTGRAGYRDVALQHVVTGSRDQPVRIRRS